MNPSSLKSQGSPMYMCIPFLGCTPRADHAPNLPTRKQSKANTHTRTPLPPTIPGRRGHRGSSRGLQKTDTSAQG